MGLIPLVYYIAIQVFYRPFGRVFRGTEFKMDAVDYLLLSANDVQARLSQPNF